MEVVFSTLIILEGFNWEKRTPKLDLFKKVSQKF